MQSTCDALTISLRRSVARFFLISYVTAFKHINIYIHWDWIGKSVESEKLKAIFIVHTCAVCMPWLQNTGTHSGNERKRTHKYFCVQPNQMWTYAMNKTMMANLKFYYNFINVTLTIIPFWQVYEWCIPGHMSVLCDYLWLFWVHFSITISADCQACEIDRFCNRFLPNFVIHIRFKKKKLLNDLWLRMHQVEAGKCMLRKSIEKWFPTTITTQKNNPNDLSVCVWTFDSFVVNVFII